MMLDRARAFEYDTATIARGDNFTLDNKFEQYAKNGVFGIMSAHMSVRYGDGFIYHFLEPCAKFVKAFIKKHCQEDSMRNYVNTIFEYLGGIRTRGKSTWFEDSLKVGAESIPMEEGFFYILC